MSSPFTYIPADLCDGFDLPVFPVDINCISYSQKWSEVCGLIILPAGGVGVADPDWRDFAEWEAIIDNSGLDATAPRYIPGIGSFLPQEKQLLQLAGGRVTENRERGYRLAFAVQNMDSGHMAFARQLQRNFTAFTFWMHTIEGRVLGGSDGMTPFYGDADIPLSSGDGKEVINITIDTEFLQYPEW